MGAADIYVEYAIKPDEPRLSAPVQKGAVRVGRMVRDYKAFVPAHLPPGSPLLLVFHGSAQESEEIRMWTGYEFDRLADLHKFAVVYPVGYGGNWNDCRKNVVYPARAQNIDDKGLVAALIDHFHNTAGIDASRVFAMGFSNGGHFVYRLALEMPDRISGVAAVAANLPTEDNNICHVAGKPVPVLIVNGTGDPINPFVGGEVALFGLGSRGTVRSSEQTAEFFVRLNQLENTSRVAELPHPEERDPTHVQRESWGGDNARVVLFRVRKGGHVIPQPYYRAPRMMGFTSHSINAPEEIWKFFAAQISPSPLP